GLGQTIDVAQYEVFFTLLENLALDFFMRGAVRGRHGTSHPRLFPYDVYRARDGWVVVAAPTPESWTKLSRLVGAHDPSWQTPAGRISHRAEVDAHLAAYCAERTVEQLEREARGADVAISAVYDIRTISRDPHYSARGMFATWEDPIAGRVKGAGVAPRFEATPGGVWRGA